MTIGKGEVAGLKVTQIQTDICTSMIRAALFTLTKRRRQPKCPSTDEWINRMYIHKWKDIKKEGHSDFCHSIDKPWKDYASGISQTQKDKDSVILFRCT